MFKDRVQLGNVLSAVVYGFTWFFARESQEYVNLCASQPFIQHTVFRMIIPTSSI